MPAGFAHSDPISTRKKHPALVPPFTEDLVYAFDVHDRGAMDLDKFSGIESFSELLDGFAQHQVLLTDMQAGVVVGSLYPLDIVDIDEGILYSSGYNQALRIFVPGYFTIFESGKN